MENTGEQLVLVASGSIPLVTISPDGEVILHRDVNLNEAAQLFWEAIAEHAAVMIERARADERNRIWVSAQTLPLVRPVNTKEWNAVFINQVKDVIFFEAS